MDFSPLPKEWRERAEHDFRMYKKWRASIKQITSELTYVSISDSAVKHEIRVKHQISDPTADEVMDREKLYQEHNELMRMVSSIDNALDAMTKRQRKVVGMRYFDQMAVQEVGKALNFEPRHVRRILNSALWIYVHICIENFQESKCVCSMS